MFTDLATVRADLEERLKEQVPEDWEIVPNLAAATKKLAAALYFEFVKFTGSVNGQALGRGTVGAQIDLTIASKETDTKKAEDAVDRHVLNLARALQMADDIFWDTAEKQRLSGGELAWKVSITALTTIPEPPSTEG